ncbi:MAG: dihydroxyacetone kinase subunit DhaL [Spirochaetota bacterium]
MNELTKQNVADMVRHIREKIEENKSFLSKLDTEIGDGDHGFSMAGGFTSFLNKIEEYSELDIGTLLKKGGFELIKTIGGAAGAVFGTFFTGQASYYDKNLQGKESIDLSDLAGMINEALEQIKKRGMAQQGDKTMVDALQPASEELGRAAREGASLPEALQRASEKAKEGAESTRNMVAKRGRARNLGERGKGYMDPGAMSTALIFEAMSEYVSQN